MLLFSTLKSFPPKYTIGSMRFKWSFVLLLFVTSILYFFYLYLQEMKINGENGQLQKLTLTWVKIGERIDYISTLLVRTKKRVNT